MLYTRIRYLIGVLLLFLLYIFYVGYLSYFLFLLSLGLPLISFLLLCLGAMKLELTWSKEEVQYEKGESACIRLLARTHSVPLAQVDAQVILYNQFTQETQRQNIHFTSEYGFSEICLPLPSESCGKLECRIEKIKVRDVLGLFRFSKHLKAETVAYIMPIPNGNQGVQLGSNRAGEEQYDKFKNGYDYGETFDVHPYRKGDSLHRVHWKLSAKVDEIMVKEGSLPMEEHAKIYFSLYGDQEQMEHILSDVYGLSQYLIRSGYRFEVHQEENNKTILFAVVENRMQLDEIIHQCLERKPTMQKQSFVGEERELSDTMFYVDHRGVHGEYGGHLYAPTK